MEIQEAVIQSSVRDHPPILEDILLTKSDEEQVKDIKKDVLVEQTQDDKGMVQKLNYLFSRNFPRRGYPTHPPFAENN